MILRGALLALLAFVASGAAAQQLTIYAAASLRDALSEIVAQHDTATGGKTRVSFASSAALAQQIVQGAPADIFISADTEWMEFLVSRGMVQKGAAKNLLTSRLVLVAPANSKIAMKIAPRFPLAGVLGNERLAVAHPDSVPAGRYGKAALTSLGVWDSVSDRLARADNVRSALALVARGEAPLGIVYSTDAQAEPRVRVVDVFPATSHPPIVYPAALVDGPRVPAASLLFRYLSSDRARAIWQRHGFAMAE